MASFDRHFCALWYAKSCPINNLHARLVVNTTNRNASVHKPPVAVIFWCGWRPAAVYARQHSDLDSVFYCSLAGQEVSATARAFASPLRSCPARAEGAMRTGRDGECAQQCERHHRRHPSRDQRGPARRWLSQYFERSSGG